MKDWHTAKEIAGINKGAAIQPATESGVIRKARAEQWRSQDVPGKGGPGGIRREYHISSLPEETRLHLLVPAATTSTSCVPSPAPTESELNEWLSTRRISLTPAQLADPKMQAKIAVARAVNACPAYSGGRERLIAALASERGVAPGTIRRWVDDIATLPARTSKPRVKLGEERVELPQSSAFSPEALACGLMSYANDLKAGMTAAYRTMQALASERNWRTGDYSNFTRLVRKLPDSLWLRIRKGSIGFELQGLPKIIKQWTAVPVQSVICGDQKIFDYSIYDPHTGQTINPNGYLWECCASRMIVGAYIEMGHYNSFTVGCSVREASRWGLADEWYTDWGSAEGAHLITDLRHALSGHSYTGDFSQMEEKYGAYGDDIRHRKAPAGKPWVKPIENINNLIEQRLISKNLPGYRKRVGDAWENKEIQQLLKKQGQRGQLMTPERFITEVYTVIDEHNRANKELKEGGAIVPLDFFIRGLMKQSRPVFDDVTLDYMCLPRYERKPNQAIVTVTIRGEKRGYYSPKLSGYRHKVSISIDPYDRDAPAILTERDGKILDIAEPWHVQNPYDRDGLSHKRRRQAELMRFVNENARRLKAGFDLYHPEVLERSPIKITSATPAAAEAAEGVRIYQLNKESAKLQSRETAREANVLREKLQLKLSNPEPEPFTPPPEGKDRYIFWIALAARKAASEPLSEEEQTFLASYPKAFDYANQRKIHERFGEGYIDISRKPLKLIEKEVNQ